MKLQRLSVMVAALWWGAISGISFMAVPLMFAKLGPALAGPVAARLFSLQCWMAFGSGLVLLLVLRRQLVGGVKTGALATIQTVIITMGIVVFAMFLALVQEFGVSQRIVMARATGGDLSLWHSLGSLMVLGQWLCAGAALWRLSRPVKR